MSTAPTSPEASYASETRVHQALRESQWHPANQRAEAQAVQIEKLVRHARAHVPFYAERLAPLFTRRGHFNLGSWQDVKPLTRSDLRDHFNALRSTQLPPEAGHAFQVKSSGSTAEPVRTLKCRLQTIASTATAARFMDWHGFDYRLPWAAIRPKDIGVASYPDGRTQVGRWGPYWLEIEDHGPWRELAMITPPEQQLEWLQRNGLCYLNTLPINLLSLVEAASGSPHLKPAIAAVVTLGETVKPDLRENCRAVLGCEILDQYSTIECGLIASQCPVSEHLHVHGEAMLVEALRADGSVCNTGEEGTACITPLLSYAMPLVRYVMSDLITLLPPCACGRSLPLMSVSGGRIRNRFRFSDGTTVSADFKTGNYDKFLGATRWQCAQTGPEMLEIRFVSPRREDEMRFDEMTALVRRMLNRPVIVNYKRIAAFPATPGGKHFDYVCELDTSEAAR
jgi:phenylacetate-CoA ligase